MKVVAVLTKKGGAGKTTLAVHLAVAAQLAGLDVAIVDLAGEAGKLLTDLRANGADLVIIDTGRASNNARYTARG
jgi:cellulose biosynthesis protein BcsQ